MRINTSDGFPCVICACVTCVVVYPLLTFNFVFPLLFLFLFFLVYSIFIFLLTSLYCRLLLLKAQKNRKSFDAFCLSEMHYVFSCSDLHVDIKLNNENKKMGRFSQCSPLFRLFVFNFTETKHARTKKSTQYQSLTEIKIKQEEKKKIIHVQKSATTTATSPKPTSAPHLRS